MLFHCTGHLVRRLMNLTHLSLISKKLWSNPHFLLLIGDFNAKSTDWSSNDTTTAEGAQLNYFTSLYGMKQVITEPTHILESPASCTDLTFTNQPNANHLLLIVVATEALVQRCSVKKVFLEISQNSQENTCCTRVSFLLKLQPSPPPPPPRLLILGFSNLTPKKIEQCKTYLSIRNSIKSNEIDFSECFRFQCYF